MDTGVAITSLYPYVLGDMPRFVVLQHDHPERLHWDFMLDQGDSLATWSLPMPPAVEHVLPARSLPDHRREYLDYEGPVSGERGSVVRWDEGRFEWVERSPECIIIDIHGAKIVGRVRLESVGSGRDLYRWYLAVQ